MVPASAHAREAAHARLKPTGQKTSVRLRREQPLGKNNRAFAQKSSFGSDFLPPPLPATGRSG